MKNILIIGGGSIGKRHMRNLFSLGEKHVFVVEPNAEMAEKEIEKKYEVKTYRSIEDAFADKDFEIAFVCSPSVYHMKQALECAKRGCDLFVEKPLSHNLEGVNKLLAIIKEKQLVTMLGSNWKFYPLFQKMKELLDNNMIGRVLSARCQFGAYLPDWHPWEDHKDGYSANTKLGGGILLESHEFDYLTWFLGDVEKLACFASRVSDITVDTEDVAEVILKMKSGAVCEIHQDYVQRFSQRDFEFFGEDGTILWNVNEKKVVLLVKDKEKEEFSLDVDYDINNMYVEQIRQFLDCVEKRKQTITPIEKGARILKLICAAKESSEEDKSIYI